MHVSDAGASAPADGALPSDAVDPAPVAAAKARIERPHHHRGLALGALAVVLALGVLYALRVSRGEDEPRT